jgi:hypothetical protein
MRSKHLFLWAVSILMVAPPFALAQWTAVGDGIEYQKFTLPDPNNVFVARMARANTNAYIESTIGQGRTPGGTEIMSSQAARYDDAIGYWGQVWGNRNNVVVAVNGSFFESDGVPFSGLVHSGWYDKRYDNLGGQSGFAWTLNRAAFIGDCVTHYSWKQLIVYITDGSVTQEFQGINVAPGDNQITIFTPQYDTDTNTDSTVTEVLVEMARPALLMPTPATCNGVVKQIRQNLGSTQIPFDCVVLSAKGTAATTLLNYAHVGDTIGISQEIHSYDVSCATQVSLDWTKTYGAVSGNFVFLRDGVILPTDNAGLIIDDPRTAIGYNSDYIFFFVVDGRSAQSIGMTTNDMGVFFRDTLGATHAVNQDGGGSSVMIVNGTVMNDPSDGSERSVANGMLMCNLVAKSVSTTYAANDTVRTNTTAAVRLGPGSNYASIASLASGTTGTVQDHAMKGVAAKATNWWKVAFPTATGWVDENQISASAPATTSHVDSIVLTTVNVSGKKKGRATVTIKDNNGDPVANATVTGQFTGDYNETRSAVTNSSGVAVIDTVATIKAKTVHFTFCVTNVTHATLTYNASANVETCDSY